jgi:hypothetical protein
MHVIVLGHCYYAGLHRGVPRDHEGLEVEGGAPGRLHHSHQSTSGRRGSACKVLFTRYTPMPSIRNLTLTFAHTPIAKPTTIDYYPPAVHPDRSRPRAGRSS